MTAPKPTFQYLGGGENLTDGGREGMFVNTPGRTYIAILFFCSLKLGLGNQDSSNEGPSSCILCHYEPTFWDTRKAVAVLGHPIKVLPSDCQTRIS
jgi:hypothetical protein